MKTLKTSSAFILACLLFMHGCGEEDIAIAEIITLQAPDSVEGNGTSTFEIKAYLNPDSDNSLRDVEFKTSAGSFDEADEENPKEATVTAEFINDSTLCALVNWKVPSKKGTVVISAEPVVEGKRGLFTVEDEVIVDTSIVSSLELSANEFSVLNNFEGEVLITGILKNNTGLGVSSGTKVMMRDVFDATEEDVNGRYRKENLSSDASSNISVLYSPGNIDPNQDILIIGTVLNQDGSQSDIVDKVKIYVKRKID